MAQRTTRLPAPRLRRYQHSPLYQLRWRLLLLFFPLVGPLLAPLFAWIGRWPFGAIAQVIYVLGETLCPLPERAERIAGYSTAVCPLCYGALLGLALIVLSFPFRPRVRQQWERIPWRLQLTLLLCALVPWLGDYVANKAGWFVTPAWMMYLLGFFGGIAVGLLLSFLGEKDERVALYKPRA